MWKNLITNMNTYRTFDRTFFCIDEISVFDFLSLLVFIVFQLDLMQKNREISVFRFLSDFILKSLDSAYSIYLICRFSLHFDLKRYEKPIFLGLSVFCRSWFYNHRNQRTQFAIHAGFGRVLIKKSKENRFFSDFRFFAGLDFITIEISVVFYSYWPVFMNF